MRSGSESHDARLKKLINHDIVLIYHGVIVLLIVMELALDTKVYPTNGIYGVLGASLLLAAIGLARYKNLWNINNKPALYLIVYHIIFAATFSQFASAYSPYVYLWIVLLYITCFFYGKKGYGLSMSLFAVTILAQAFRVLPSYAGAPEYIKFIGMQILVIGASGLFFLKAEEVSDQDRIEISKNANAAEVESQRLVSLINSMTDGVIATDENGIIKIYNAATLNILDTNDSLVDREIKKVLPLIDQSAKTIDILEDTMAKNVSVVTSDYLLVYPDGEKINIFLSISPIKLGFKEKSEHGFIIAFRDITREKSLEEERNEFISVVSHELRTPIAITEANISNAQFLAEKGDNLGAVKTSLDAAHKQALFLANMINDLSTLSRAERGSLDMVTEDVRPREIMKSIEEDYTKEAKVKNLELKVVVDESTPESILSNRLYVREILQNFVTNSIKYTKQGSVTVTSKAAEGGVEFSVQDTGIGISKSDQKRVFDKFFRSEDFRTRESSGTGLGLYVTKKLMRLIEANISLKSKLDEGSTFTVFVPDQKSKTKA